MNQQPHALFLRPAKKKKSHLKMVNFVVTGANKGIGFEIVKGLLDASAKAFVFLGSRDAARGASAVEALVAQNPESYSGRVEPLHIDVSDDGSVSRAAAAVRSRLQSSGGGGDGESSSRVAAIINNAGMNPDDPGSADGLASCINVNFRGVVRTTEAFLPLLEPSGGRVVITSSASGPMFVAKCSAERQAFMTDPAVTSAQITALVDECNGIASSSGGSMEERFAAAGLNGVEGQMGAYGLSKASAFFFCFSVPFVFPPSSARVARDGCFCLMHVMLFQPYAKPD